MDEATAQATSPAANELAIRKTAQPEFEWLIRHSW